jgi:hypothetical protein
MERLSRIDKFSDRSQKVKIAYKLKMRLWWQQKLKICLASYILIILSSYKSLPSYVSQKLVCNLWSLNQSLNMLRCPLSAILNLLWFITQLILMFWPTYWSYSSLLFMKNSNYATCMRIACKLRLRLRNRTYVLDIFWSSCKIFF